MRFWQVPPHTAVRADIASIGQSFGICNAGADLCARAALHLERKSVIWTRPMLSCCHLKKLTSTFSSVTGVPPHGANYRTLCRTTSAFSGTSLIGFLLRADVTLIAYERCWTLLPLRS